MPDLTRIRELLDYDPLTGIFTWKVDRGLGIGARAGSLKWKRTRDHRVIILDGCEYNEHRLAWLMSYGEWPSTPVIHINGDQTDNRLENLALIQPAQHGCELTAERLRELMTYDPLTGEFEWRVIKAARLMNGGPRSRKQRRPTHYVCIGVDGQVYRAHRLVWLYVHGRWPVDKIDHINGDRSDNRLCNLREARQVENSFNRRRNRNNTSGYRGVYPHGQKWHGQIRAYGETHHLGVFDKKEDAAAAVRAASRSLHGEFGRTD